jgi:hypothetical protein
MRLELRTVVRVVFASALAVALLGVASVPAQDIGSFDPFVTEPFSPPGGVAYVEDPTSSAPTKMVYAFDFPSGYCSTKKYGDGKTNDCMFNSTRSQIVEDVAQTKKYGIIQPKESWYGFSIYFPADFPYGRKQTTGHYDFAYWHNDHCAHLSLQNFAGNEDALSLATQTAVGGYECRPGPTLKVADFADLVGKWNRFEIFVRWGDEDTGVAKLYLNGVYVLDYKGRTLTPGLERKNYFKFGLYLCCTADTKQIVATHLLYAAVKRAETRDGLFVSEDNAALKALQGRLNALGCDVGAADGVIGRRTREMALSCREFPEGKMPLELSASTVRMIDELYASEDVANLPRGTFDPDKHQAALVTYPSDGSAPIGELVAATYDVLAIETQSKRRGQDRKVISDISARIKKLKDPSQVDFVVTGSYDFSGDNFYDLQLILADAMKNPKATIACGAGTTTYPDGSAHATITFRRSGNDLFATNANCLISNLPKNQSLGVQFLVEHFSDIAVGMIKTGSAALVQHDGLKSFVQRVARGEVKVRPNAS